MSRSNYGLFTEFSLFTSIPIISIPVAVLSGVIGLAVSLAFAPLTISSILAFAAGSLLSFRCAESLLSQHHDDGPTMKLISTAIGFAVAFALVSYTSAALPLVALAYCATQSASQSLICAFLNAIDIRETGTTATAALGSACITTLLGAGAYFLMAATPYNIPALLVFVLMDELLGGALQKCAVRS